MVQAKFVLELLMRLLACPAGLDRADQRSARRVRRVVGEVIFALAAGACFAYQPGGLARKMLPMRSVNAARNFLKWEVLLRQ